MVVCSLGMEWLCIHWGGVIVNSLGWVACRITGVDCLDSMR